MKNILLAITSILAVYAVTRIITDDYRETKRMVEANEESKKETDRLVAQAKQDFREMDKILSDIGKTITNTSDAQKRIKTILRAFES